MWKPVNRGRNQNFKVLENEDLKTISSIKVGEKGEKKDKK